jgi:hypothetical protein
MVDENHLRQLASRCLWLSQNCYDLSAAAQLRLLASELNEGANESKRQPRAQTEEPQGKLKPRAH